MLKRLDIDDRHVANATRIMAGPLPERPLGVAPGGGHVAFEHDLGIGREGEAGRLAAHHPGGRAAHAADDVELERTVGRLDPAGEERDGIAADYDRDGHRLAALETCLAVDPSVM